MARPRVNSEGQRELDKVEDQIGALQQEIQSFNPLDELAPLPEETEPQVPMSKKEMKKDDAPYIRPKKTLAATNTPKSPTVWNKRWQKMHDRDWEYVKITAENHELIGGSIEMWTREYGCDPAHFWDIPVNRPIWVPRLVARKIARCTYHRLTMDNSIVTHGDQVGQVVGGLVVDHTKHRLNAIPCGESFSASNF